MSDISDGFGNEWTQCEACHNLVVVRPGKVQCDCEVTDDDIETQTPWKMHDWNLGKGCADDG